MLSLFPFELDVAARSSFSSLITVRKNPKCPPQWSKPQVSALNVKTLSAHLKAQNPNCPPQSFEP